MHVSVVCRICSGPCDQSADFVADFLDLLSEVRQLMVGLRGRSGRIVLRTVAAGVRRRSPPSSCDAAAVELWVDREPGDDDGLPGVVEALLMRHLLEENEALTDDFLEVVGTKS